MSYKILILGASYGSLVGTKLALAGHDATLVCTSSTADLINREGTRVRFPLKGREEKVEVHSSELGGRVDAAVPQAVNPADYDLVILGMQEAQYGADGVRELTARIAAARIPCLAIMNMPPLPFLKRIPGLQAQRLTDSYTHPGVWDGFEAGKVSLASPDPQAFRPVGSPKNVLEVGLPTNFKAAPFADAADNAILMRLADDIETATYECDGETIALPVKLKVHESLFVPLAKWPMLIAGNYRCVTDETPVPIRDAVHTDAEQSRAVYESVAALCVDLGASPSDLVPFEKYAKAAQSLGKPSSAARALAAGAEHIERVDRLVLALAAWKNVQIDSLAVTVARVDGHLERNRAHQQVA